MRRARTLRALAGGLICFSAGAWCERTVHALASHERAGIPVTRIFTGADGQTHAEVVAIPMLQDDASTEISAVATTGVRFRRQAPGYFEDWHTAPRKQYVVTLSGHGEIELGGGEKISLGPGHVLLAEDLTGRGHVSRGVGTEARVSLVIPIAE